MSLRTDNLPPYLLGGMAEAVKAARSSGHDVIDLSHLNPNFEPPAAAVESLVRATLLPHNHRYSSSQGITKLRESICNWYGSRYGVELSPATDAVVTMGVKEGLSHLLLAMLTAGDTVVIPTPSYPIHTAAIFLAGASSLRVPIYKQAEDFEQAANPVLSEESEFFFSELETVCHASWPRPKVMLLSFPHNPTGITVDLSFYERLLAFAEKNDIFLLQDFAYSEVRFENYSVPSLLQAKGAKKRAVEFFSLSKAFNVPGWRVGFCVGNEKLIASLKRIKSYVDFGVFQPLQIAAIDVLREGVQIAAETAGTYESRRNVLVHGLRQAGWAVAEPKASVFVWARIPTAHRAQGSQAFTAALLEQAHVAVSPGVGFDAHADEFVRFALVESETRLRVGIRSIEKFLATHLLGNHSLGSQA